MVVLWSCLELKNSVGLKLKRRKKKHCFFLKLKQVDIALLFPLFPVSLEYYDHDDNFSGNAKYSDLKQSNLFEKEPVQTL